MRKTTKEVTVRHDPPSRIEDGKRGGADAIRRYMTEKPFVIDAGGSKKRLARVALVKLRDRITALLEETADARAEEARGPAPAEGPPGD